MSTQKAERVYRELAESEGLRVTKVLYGKHMKLYVSAPDGREAVVTAPRSPSDNRGIKNKRSDFRKFFRGGSLGRNDEHFNGDE